MALIDFSAAFRVGCGHLCGHFLGVKTIRGRLAAIESGHSVEQREARTREATAMSNPPIGWHTITPRIFTEDPEGLVEFVKQTFGATGEYQTIRPSEIRIGDSVLMISGTEFRGRQTACLYVYVSDVDEVFKRSVSAGVKIIEAPTNMPYGDRRCTVEDGWGNVWQIATR